MKIIAIGHYKRTGKDSFANYLISACYDRNPKLRVGKASWAWKMKQICFDLYGWAGLREPVFYETSEGEKLREVVLPAIGMSPREIWIKFGTNAIREQVYDRTWLEEFLHREHHLDVVLIPDTRFHNEVQAVKELGAHLVKVVRPGYGPGKNKPDRELLGFNGWDNVIGETGALSDLKKWAERYADWLAGYTIRGRSHLTGPEPSRPAAEIKAALAVEKIEPWEDKDKIPAWVTNESILNPIAARRLLDNLRVFNEGKPVVVGDVKIEAPPFDAKEAAAKIKAELKRGAERRGSLPVPAPIEGTICVGTF